MNSLEQNHIEDGGHLIPPGTLCADGCGKAVPVEEYVRVGDRYFVSGHEKEAQENAPEQIH